MEQLYTDNSVDVTDGITWDANVTFEELINVVLSARDEIKLSRSEANGVSGFRVKDKRVICFQAND